MRPWFRTPLRAVAAAPAAPATLPPGSTTENRSASLLSIIRPSIRDRWSGPVASQYTPARVEQTIRSAMAGDLEATWQMFDLMESTWPELAHALNELKGVVETLKWPVQPWTAKGQKPTPEAVRRARLFEDALWSMTPDPVANEDDFTDLLKDLADAWGKGIALVELDWHPRETPEGIVMSPRAGRWVHPRHYGYSGASGQPDRLMLRLSTIRAEHAPGAALLTAGSPDGQWSEIPRDKFLVAVAKQKSGHPTGSSLLRLLGTWWCAISFNTEWFLNFVQMFGQPIRWASYDPNISPDELTRLNAMLELMGSAAWASFPSTVKLELKEPVRQADPPHVRLHEIATRVVNVLILGQTLTSSEGDKGTQALGNVHADVLAGRKLALANWLARIINGQLVPTFCRLNWGDLRERPVLLTGAEAKKDTKSAAETLDIVLRRAPVGREFYYDAVGVPAPGPEDDVIEVTAPPAPVDPAAAPSVPATARARTDCTAHAAGADGPLLVRVMEDVAGVQEDWLGAVRPVFADLLALAKSEGVTDEQLTATVRDLQRRMPDLFARLDTGAVADALERALGAGVVNGAVAADQRRRTRRTRRGGAA